MTLLALQQAIRIPLRIEEAFGCPRCHTRLDGSFQCDRCNFRMSWREGAIVCRPEEPWVQRAHDTAAPDRTLGRFLPSPAQMILDCSGGSFDAGNWMREHPWCEVVRLSDGEQAEGPGLRIASPFGEVPMADRTLDAVLAPDLEPAASEWEAAAFYREAQRVLRPGGWLVARTRRMEGVRSLEALKRRLERGGFRYLGGETEWTKLWGVRLFGRRFTAVAARA